MAKEREERPWKDESDLRCVLMKTKTAQRERVESFKFFLFVFENTSFELPRYRVLL